MWPARIVMGAWILAMTSVAWAQTTQPATRPDLAPTSSPKDAALAFSAAMQAGDTARILSLLRPDNSREERMAAVLANTANAMAELAAQAQKSFGPEQAKELVGDVSGNWAQETGKLQSASQTIVGNVATLKDTDGRVTILKLTDGQWKLPVAQLAREQDPALFDNMLAILAVRVKVLRRLTVELADGRYKSADTALQALRATLLNPESGQDR